MEISKRIARILGPVLIALPVTEGVNLHAFAENPAPVVYLNGTLLFTAGVAIVQAHGRWRAGWSALVTLAGWGMVLAGVYRMAWPAGPQAMENAETYGLLAVLLAVGIVLTWQGYSRRA